MQQKNNHIISSFLYPICKWPSFLFFISMMICASCQKELKLTYGVGEIKQVIIANIYPNDYLRVSISKSKQPNDFNPIDFLPDCNVSIYEDGVFKETLPFVLKDTLSGLGYYKSSFTIQPNKTYKIISTHAQLGTAEATEYVPSFPNVLNVSLLQHADSAHPSMTGSYSLTFQDSAGVANYYYMAVFYQILKPVVNNNGDTTYVYDYIFNIPSFTPEIPNPSNFERSFTTDATFDGQTKTFVFTFPSQYNNIYKEITLIGEFANTGKNFYNWNIQQIPKGTAYLNEGQEERTNLTSNIINGYGHFTANSSFFISVPIK